jgi:hypothetical protein
MALREFLSKTHILEPVVVQASVDEVARAADTMIHEYADTLDGLK